MAYTGKKPIDHTDVTQSQSMTVTDDLTVDTDTLVVDSTNNRVGINKSDPDNPLDVYSSSAGTLAQFRSQDGTNNPRFSIYGDSSGTHLHHTWSSGAGNMMFEVGGSAGSNEKMRIDSSGTVLVGKTSGDNNANGVILRPSSYATFTNTSARAIIANRKTSDGSIIDFRKDNATVGSIGVDNSDNLYIQGTSTAAGLQFGDGGSGQVLPHKNGADVDNVIDLGNTGRRFDDIYATNGTIQTSDQNEKQQIASLTDAEVTAAKAISTLFKTFKWNDKVEAKGDAARTHTGVIAQDVQQAMTDAGLDAGDYAFFISATWWETQTEVPAVEADEENGIEAADAYTRTDTYDTAEEAPEGATERTRLGIRYPELLAFVGAATEQRLADIETRLTALEAN